MKKPAKLRFGCFCFTKVVLAICALMFAGCSSNDFKVVDALHTGMTREEAKATIQSYGFRLEESFSRPADGWPRERKTFTATEWRAGREEERVGKHVMSVELYPVGHGLLGAGLLFLFYGEDGSLMNFYRYQVN